MPRQRMIYTIASYALKGKALNPLFFGNICLIVRSSKRKIGTIDRPPKVNNQSLLPSGTVTVGKPRSTRDFYNSR
ncbi:MAG: hypothetical protein WBL95_02310 [Microcoleus sp.]